MLPNAFDNSYMWGPSSFDHRNLFVGTAVYALPIFKTGNGLAHKLLGGWSIDGVYTYTSGSDFSISTGTDYAGVGVGGGAQYWVQNGPIQYTDQYSQGGTAADPNFFFKPTNASGTAEFTPRPPEPSTPSASGTRSTGLPTGILTRRFSRISGSMRG